MDNFILNDDGIPYVTLFGLNYMNKKAYNLKYLPDNLKQLLIPTIVPDATIIWQNIYQTFDGVVHVTAEVEYSKGRFRITTEGEENIIKLDEGVRPEDAVISDVSEVAVEEIPEPMGEDTVNSLPDIEESIQETIKSKIEVDSSIKDIDALKETITQNYAQIESKITEIKDSVSVDKIVDQIVDKLANKLKDNDKEVISKAIRSIDNSPVLLTKEDFKKAEHVQKEIQEVVEEVKVEYDQTTLPKYCFEKTSAFSLKRLKLEDVIDDNYCIKNKWEKKGDFYVVDAIPRGKRFIHSDKLNVNLSVTFAYVSERANG